MALEDWGWDGDWAARLGAVAAGDPARVVGQDRALWAVQTGSGACMARLVPRSSVDVAPAVGDWVVVEPGPTPTDPHVILSVLPRRSTFSRGEAHTGASEQVLAANVDEVWIVHGLDVDPNPRRLERYLAVAWESGAVPVVVLTKADLAADAPASRAEVERIAMGVDVCVVSAHDAESVERLETRLRPGRTVAVLGASGVGKSTLVNVLAGEALAETGSVRAGDHKGRHTTTRRELLRIHGGALLLDTPGLRELRVWSLDEGLERAFPEIDELAAACRFRDCAHEAEPGCAVLEAVADGRLDADRLSGFRKLRAEAAFQARKTDPLARAAAIAEHKTAVKSLEYHPKYEGRR